MGLRETKRERGNRHRVLEMEGDNISSDESNHRHFAVKTVVTVAEIPSVRGEPHGSISGIERCTDAKLL